MNLLQFRIYLCLCFICTCMYCMNCFFVDNVARLLSYVNMCACHVYFTINLLTYLLIEQLHSFAKENKTK